MVVKEMVAAMAMLLITVIIIKLPDEVNLAAGREVAVLTSQGEWRLKPELFNMTDDDVTTGITLSQDDVIYRVNLGQMVEIHTVTVSTSGT